MPLSRTMTTTAYRGLLIAAVALTLPAHQALAAAAAEPAPAGTCQVVANELRYTAAPGVANELSIGRAGQGPGLVFVLLDQAGPIKGTCKPDDEPGAVKAPATIIEKIKITTGDGDDIVTVDPAVNRRLVMLGGEGTDELNGGKGDDDLRGGGGEDELRGGEGRDALHGGSGDDDLRGGPGNDELNGNGGEDELNGGAGNDELNGGAGPDELNGGADVDSCSGGPGADSTAGCEE